MPPRETGRGEDVVQVAPARHDASLEGAARGEGEGESEGGLARGEVLASLGPRRPELNPREDARPSGLTRLDDDAFMHRVVNVTR
ncbi:MAG: hypothetical protein B7Z69_00320 [Actinobacteria bacterium 21-73-9]|nr:MAG: hypothetical protein B7Z69_00320 [Actinobacteria bacterium 21-73-9]